MIKHVLSAPCLRAIWIESSEKGKSLGNVPRNCIFMNYDTFAASKVENFQIGFSNYIQKGFSTKNRFGGAYKLITAVTGCFKWKRWICLNGEMSTNP